MSVPQPPTELKGHCSAIHNGTLYVLSPGGFQSLPLKKNATWSEEASGQSVTNPACVKAIPNGDESQAALYVVGGESKDDSYGGLQRYWFGKKTWETLSLPTDNMQDRTNHSAAYLSDSQSILVYGGSTPNAPSLLSSQTFAISTIPPYNVEAFTSQAPPTNQPILEAWNSSHAVMVGGSEYNTEVFTFGPTAGWHALGTNLTDPIDAASRGTIVDGSDGSKVLEVFNVNESPNTISQIVLLDSNGRTAKTGQTVGGGSSSRKRKRDLTLNNWPSYNSTGAPTATRTDCALAVDPKGTAVVSGGNTDAPLAMFDTSDSSWVDVDQFFNSKEQQPLKPSSTSASASPTATTSSQPSASTTAAGGSGGGLTPHQRMLRTLGITLGVLCGIAAAFILVLLFLRWRKMKARKQEGYIDEKTGNGNRMSFADRGASFMKEAGGSMGNLLPPGNNRFNQSSNGGSHSSLAIITGKIGGSKRNTVNHLHKDSSESTRHLVKDKNGVTGEPVEMLDIGDNQHLSVPSRKPVPRGDHPPGASMPYDSEKELLPTSAMDDRDRKRSSGWSKYFATSGPTGPNGISHLPAAYLKPQTNSGLSGTSDGSDYSSRVASQPSRIPSSILVPPLDIDFSRTFDGQRLSHVTTGSPAFSNSQEHLARQGSTPNVSEGQSGLIVGSPSNDRRSQISGYSLSTNKRTTVGSTLSSNFTSDYYNESGNTPFTPMSFKDHVNSPPSQPSSSDGHDRGTSSQYGDSVYEPRIHSRGNNGGGGGFFPGAGTSYRPAAKSSPKFSSSAAPTSEWAAPKAPALSVTKPAEDRDSTITVFPRGVSSAYYNDRDKAKMNEQSQQQQPEQKTMVNDMSWLNLGLNNQNKI